VTGNDDSDAAGKPLVVGIGEALYDCFPTHQVLGGAPLNVAVHSSALLNTIGGSAVAVTRVGADELGDRLIAELSDLGLSSDFVQRDKHLPTGRVDVSIDATGQADYRFDEPSAWDNIVFDEPLRELSYRCDAMTFGTLSQRAETTRATIRAFAASATQALRLFDANLRQHYYDGDVIDATLRLATAAKFNDAELLTVGELLELGDPNGHNGDELANRLADTYRLDWIAVTHGKDGVVLFADGRKHVGATCRLTPVEDADTVGAGDASCAALVCGFLMKWPIERTLQLANAIGAFVASRPGATPRLPNTLLDMTVSPFPDTAV
jgi:fructokinase